MTTGVVRHACRHRVTARGGFWFGGFFHMLGAWERHRFNGGAVAVCFEGCCGGMCWPQERQHEGLGVGGLIRCAGRPREWSCGAVPPQERWHEGGWFLFFLGGCSGVGGGFFHTLGAWERHRFNGGAVAVCFEGCCGSMCWPRERPATHAAAGAAARGSWVFAAAQEGGEFRNDGGLGGFFHTLSSGPTIKATRNLSPPPFAPRTSPRRKTD